MKSYNYTGNNIPIDINSTLAYVIKLLKEYDDNLEKGILLSESPYLDKIIMKTDTSVIEIPYDIQQEAIKKWEIIKTDLYYENEKKSIQRKIEILSDKLDDSIKENFNSKSNNYVYLKILLIIVILIFIIYFLNKNKIGYIY